jgi:hypothetical protein
MTKQYRNVVFVIPAGGDCQIGSAVMVKVANSNCKRGTKRGEITSDLKLRRCRSRPDQGQ